MTDWKRDLIDAYISRKAMSVGHFTLASGATSDFYIDGRKVATYPPGLRAITTGMGELIRAKNLAPAGCTLIGPALGGVPLATAVSLALDIPFVMDRGKPKEHGLSRRYEGVFGASPRCLVLDDVITVGSTLVKTIEGLREEGKEVRDAVLVVDREEGGRDALAKHGVTLHALLTKTELKAALKEKPPSP
jgi:orotate phosphoribosyltransferase